MATTVTVNRSYVEQLRTWLDESQARVPRILTDAELVQKMELRKAWLNANPCRTFARSVVGRLLAPYVGVRYVPSKTLNSTIETLGTTNPEVANSFLQMLDLIPNVPYTLSSLEAWDKERNGIMGMPFRAAEAMANQSITTFFKAIETAQKIKMYAKMVKTQQEMAGPTDYVSAVLKIAETLPDPDTMSTAQVAANLPPVPAALTQAPAANNTPVIQ